MLVDCDSHFFPRDAFDYIEGPLADRRPSLKLDEQGHLVDIDFPGAYERLPGTTPLPAPGSGAHHMGMTDMEARLSDYARMGVEKQMLLPQFTGWWSYLIEPDLGAAMAHSWNVSLLNLMRSYPDQLEGVALVALQDPEAAVKELEWAHQNGITSVVVDHTFPVKDHPFGTPVASHREAWPFFKRCEELDMPVFLHAVQHGHRIVNVLPFQMDGLDMYAPKDAEMNLVAVITSGLLDEYPGLKFIHAEQGTQYIQPLAERLDAIYHKGHGGSEYREDEGASAASRRVLSPKAPQLVPPELASEKNRLAPSHYFKNNFYWTIETEEPELPDAMAFVGADHFLFATDYPHEDPGGLMKFKDRELLEDNARISEADKDLVRSGNAIRIFHLS